MPVPSATGVSIVSREELGIELGEMPLHGEERDSAGTRDFLEWH